MGTLAHSIPILAGLCASLHAAPAEQTPKTYTISATSEAGVDHVTTLTMSVPGWSEALDAQGSPEFRRDPLGMFAVLNVLPGTPAAVIAVLFGDAKHPTTRAVNGRTWIVDRQPDGHVHAALLFAAAPGFVVLCETRHDTRKLDVIAEVERVCDTVKLAKP